MNAEWWKDRGYTEYEPRPTGIHILLLHCSLANFHMEIFNIAVTPGYIS